MAESSIHVQITSKDNLNRKFKWYKAGLERVNEPSQTLLEKYSKIPDDQIVNHVMQVVRTFGPSPLGEILMNK